MPENTLNNPLFTEADIDELFPRPILPEINDDSAQFWRRSVFARYRHYVKMKLKEIVCSAKNNDVLLPMLQNFLTKHWKTTASTSFFAYTATPAPFDTVRNGLTVIAERLGAALKVHPITLLMPDVVLEPMIEGVYPNLATVPLSVIFNQYIVFKKHYLLPVTLLLEHCKTLSETDVGKKRLYNPYYDITCDYAAGEEYLIVDDTALERLRSHSRKVEELYDAFITYDTLIHSEKSLLGWLLLFRAQLARYDANNGRGIEDEAGSGTSAALVAFGEYYRNLEACGLVVQNEIPTSIDELPQGQNIGYVLVTSENIDNTTLYVLNRFNNTVKDIPFDNTPTEDTLQQTPAAYLASTFSNRQHSRCTSEELYLITTLTKHDYLSEYIHVPTKLRDAIQTFLSYQNYAKNKAHWQATCTGTNGTTIEGLIGTYRTDLAAIGLNAKEYQRQLAIATENLEENRKPLIQLIEQGKYTGSDNHLGLPFTLFNEMDIKLEISDYNMFLLLHTFLPEDIYTLLTDTANVSLREDLLGFIELADADGFLFYLTQTPAAPLRAVLRALKVASSLSVSSLVDVMQSLTNEKLVLLLEIFQDDIQIDHLAVILKRLSSEQKTLVLKGIETRLPELITSSSDLKILFSLLDLEQRSVVLNVIKGCFSQLVTNALDVDNVLQKLSKKERVVFLEDISERFPTFITTAGDIRIALRHCPIEQRAVLLKSIDMRFPDLIESLSDINIILHYCSSDQCVVLLKLIEDRLPVFINECQDWDAILDVLNDFEKNGNYDVFFDAIKTLLLPFIKTASQLHYVLSYFSAKERIDFFKAKRTEVSALIVNSNDLGIILRDIPFQEYASFLNSIERRVLDLIMSIEDLRIVVGSLPAQKVGAFLGVIDTRLSALIRTPNDICFVLNGCSKGQSEHFLKAIEMLLFVLIASFKDVMIVLPRGTMDIHGGVFLTAIESRLPGFIRDFDDMYTVLYYFSPEQRIVFLNAIEERLPLLILNEDDRSAIVAEFKEAQRYPFFHPDNNIDSVKRLGC